jgi:tRNA(Phe) wybutosine-synthesizing methylase Tyw3
MALPVKSGEKILVEENYLKKILEKANKKLEKNYFQLKKFTKTVKKTIK